MLMYALPKNRKVHFVKAKLKGTASLWWHNVQNQLYKTGQPPIDIWDGMNLKMKVHFFPVYYEQHMYTKLFYLKECTKLVKEYTKEIYKLSIQNQVWKIEAQTCSLL